MRTVSKVQTMTGKAVIYGLVSRSFQLVSPSVPSLLSRVTSSPFGHIVFPKLIVFALNFSHNFIRICCTFVKVKILFVRVVKYLSQTHKCVKALMCKIVSSRFTDSFAFLVLVFQKYFSVFSLQSPTKQFGFLISNIL